jgi:hypothetical protein
LEKVREGWEVKQRGKVLTPPNYRLNTDFEEELE